MLDSPWWRFALSGTLISIFGTVSWLASRRVRPASAIFVRMGHVHHAISFVSLLVFYHFIRVDGGTLLGGWGNLAGIGLVGAVSMFRWRTRHGTHAIPYPGTVSRVLFDAALPLAVGTPWGFLALTAPALATATWAAARERLQRPDALPGDSASQT